MGSDTDDRYDRLLQRYPVGELTPDELEEWVVKVLTSVGLDEGIPNLEVQLHEHVVGTDGTYEIDATVRYRALGVDIVCLVEVKQHKNRIKRELVQVLHDKVRSTGAHKGIMFSTAHFQSGALEYAKTHGIALVFITEGRLTFEQRSAEPTAVMSRDQAVQLGLPPIAGTYFGAGDQAASIQCAYIGPDRPDLVASYLLPRWKLSFQE